MSRLTLCGLVIGAIQVVVVDMLSDMDAERKRGIGSSSRVD